MAILVNPQTAHPTHHLKLSDNLGNTLGLIITDGQGRANPRAWGRNPIPRQSLKMYSGQQTWADMEPPWTPVGQDDWSGGRASEDFDKDASRYYDGWTADTTRANEVTLGGHPVYWKGMRTAIQNWPYTTTSGGAVNRTLTRLTHAVPYFAVRFTTVGVLDYRRIVFLAQATMAGAGGNALDVSIYTDVAGAPGVAVFTDTVANTTSNLNVINYFKVDVPAATGDLGAATNYWLVFHHDPGASVANYWELLTTTSPASTSATSADGLAWVGGGTAGPWFRILDADDNYRAHFFEYRGALYAILSYEDAGAVKVLLNGDHGRATGVHSSTTLQDTAKAGPAAWTVDEWAGCILKLCEGTGSMAENPYRQIVSNTANTLTVSPAMEIAPADGTIYTILASDKWKEVGAGHGMTGKITDVLVSGFLVYFARGDTTAVKRMRAYDNGGVWTYDLADDDADFTAFYLEQIGDQVYKAERGTCEIDHVTASTYAGGVGVLANLPFPSGGPVIVGNVSDKITNIIEYAGDLWIFKEASAYTYDGTNLDIVPFYGMGAVADPRNGYSATKSGVYLYFSLQDGLERYYANTLDDIGPNRDAGLPSNRRGFVSVLSAYPGRLLAAVDGGDSNYSSILVRNANGWHEAYRSPFNFGGHRILGMHPQSIPGDSVDRLWFSCGSDLVWIPLSLNPVTHPNVDYNFYPYTWESHLITSWLYLGMKDVEKFFHSLKLVLAEVAGSVLAEFQTADNLVQWYTIGTYTTALQEEALQISAPNDVTGRSIRLKLKLRSGATDTTPRLLALVAEAISRVPYKYATSFTCRLADNDTDLEGNPDGQGTADTRLGRLETWAASALPVTLNAISDLFDSTVVLVEAPAVQPNKTITADGREAHLAQVTLIEV